MKTVRWDRVKVRVMCIEVNRIPEGQPALVSYMRSLGYLFLGRVGIDAWFGWPDLLGEAVVKKLGVRK